MSRAGKLLEAAKPTIKSLIGQSSVKVVTRNVSDIYDAVNFGEDQYYTKDYKFLIEIRPTFLSVIELKNVMKPNTDCKAYMLKLKLASITKNNNQDAKLLREEIEKVVASGELVKLDDAFKAKDYEAFGDHLEVALEGLESEEVLAEIKSDLAID